MAKADVQPEMGQEMGFVWVRVCFLGGWWMLVGVFGEEGRVGLKESVL